MIIITWLIKRLL